MAFSWFDLVGMAGVIVIITAYLLLQLDKLASSALSYSLLNALGALLVIISLFINFNLAAFVVESFWFLISVLGAVRRLASKPSVAQS